MGMNITAIQRIIQISGELNKVHSVLTNLICDDSFEINEDQFSAIEDAEKLLDSIRTELVQLGGNPA